MTETKIKNLFLNIFDLHNGYILKDKILFLKENNGKFIIKLILYVLRYQKKLN